MTIATVRAARFAILFSLAGCSGGGGGGGSNSGGIPLPSGPSPVLTSVSVTAVGGAGGSMVVGQTLQLAAAPKDQAGNAFSATVTWTTSAATVANVSASGLVTAVTPGSATITATATAGSATTSASFSVTVVAAPVLTSVAITGNVALTTGQTSQLTATPKDQNGAAFTATVSWSSSASGIASVTSTGVVTAVASGSATITATATAGATTVSSTVSVTVTAPVPVLTSVSINPATSSVQAGQTATLTAAPVDQFGAAIAASVTWSTSNASVATITQAGVVTGVTVGTTTITATAVAGGVTRAATRAISVTAAPPVLTSVAISGSSSNVVVGGTLQLSATARDQGGAPIAASLTWSSSNGGRATVNSSGLVTGVAGGAVTINVEATAGTVTVADATSVTVQALTSVVISGGTSVAAGQTLQLSAAAKDQNGNAIAGATIAWSSNATGVATVGPSTGLVTGVAAGSANITALATLGSATASAFEAITVAAAPSYPVSASVSTPGNTFAPASVDIAAGGTVTWSLNGIHNVTFDAAPGAPANIPTGSGGSRTFNTTGAFNYQCTIHLGMNGTVTVH